MNIELKKWLSDYENGQEVETVIMGGLGAAYEAAIHTLAIRMMNILQEKPVSDDSNDIDSYIHSTVTDAQQQALKQFEDPYGLSGAQVDAASNIAAMYWVHTPQIALDMLRATDPERIFRIKKSESGSVVIKPKQVERL